MDGLPDDLLRHLFAVVAARLPVFPFVEVVDAHTLATLGKVCRRWRAISRCVQLAERSVVELASLESRQLERRTVSFLHLVPSGHANNNTNKIDMASFPPAAAALLQWLKAHSLVFPVDVSFDALRRLEIRDVAFPVSVELRAPALQVLELSRADVADVARLVVRCTRLARLALDSVCVAACSDVSLPSLECLTVEFGRGVDPFVRRCIASCPRLSKVRVHTDAAAPFGFYLRHETLSVLGFAGHSGLSGNFWPDSGGAPVLRPFNMLRVLELCTTAMNEADFLLLWPCVPAVATLRLSGCCGLTDAALSALPHTVRRLEVSDCELFTGTALRDVLHNLEVLSLTYNFNLAAGCLSALSNARALRELDLSGSTRLSALGFHHVRHCTALRSLWVDPKELTPSDVAVVLALPTLDPAQKEELARPPRATSHPRLMQVM